MKGYFSEPGAYVDRRDEELLTQDVLFVLYLIANCFAKAAEVSLLTCS